MAKPDEQRTYTQRVLIAVAVVCLVLLVLAAAYFAFDILLLIFAAALLAIFLHGLADLVRRWLPLSEGWLVMIVAVLLLVVVAGAVTLLAPSVAEQVRVLRVNASGTPMIESPIHVSSPMKIIEPAFPINHQRSVS